MDMNENQMIFNDDEEFSMTDDQYLNPKYMFKLHWIAEPSKLKLKKPNIDHSQLDQLNSSNSNAAVINHHLNDRHLTYESHDEMVIVPFNENKEGEMIV